MLCKSLVTYSQEDHKDLVVMVTIKPMQLMLWNIFCVDDDVKRLNINCWFETGNEQQSSMLLVRPSTLATSQHRLC